MGDGVTESFQVSGKKVTGPKLRYYSPDEDTGICIHLVMDECCSMVGRMKGCDCRESVTPPSDDFGEDRRRAG